MQRTILSIILLGLFFQSVAQEPIVKKERNWTLNGYVSWLNTNTFDSIQKTWFIDNELQNRLNFSYFPTKDITFNVQMRNRLIYGYSKTNIPKYDEYIEDDIGYLQLSKNFINTKSMLFNMKIDRINLEINKGNWNVKLGRQRINWGKTFVRNPNDIFNTYSYFDIDYQEKPGSDGARVEYYTSAVSSIELASTVNFENRMTMAGKYNFNHWNYDFQLLAGEMEQRDYVIGFGWAGAIKSFSFKGEASYFTPIDSQDPTREPAFLGTVYLDYTFANSFNMMIQGLYNQIGIDNPIKDFSTFYYANSNAKYLSFTEWNLFANMQYPISPLFTVSFGTMLYPGQNMFFLNPTATISLSDNSELGIIWQYFRGEFPNALGVKQLQQGNYAFLRLRMNF